MGFVLFAFAPRARLANRRLPRVASQLLQRSFEIFAVAATYRGFCIRHRRMGLALDLAVDFFRPRAVLAFFLVVVLLFVERARGFWSPRSPSPDFTTRLAFFFLSCARDLPASTTSSKRPPLSRCTYRLSVPVSINSHGSERPSDPEGYHGNFLPTAHLLLLGSPNLRDAHIARRGDH